MAEENIEKLTTSHLLKISKLVASSCPPASRFYISNIVKRSSETSNILKPKDFCQHCCSRWTIDNCKIHIKKRPLLSKKMKKLMEVEDWKKSKKLKKKINKFCGATNKLVYTCLVCSHKTCYPGTKRRGQTTNRPTPIPPLNKSTNFKKRRDWNAGLFLSPCQLDNSEISEVSKSMRDSEMPIKSTENNLLEEESLLTPGVKISSNCSSQRKVTPKTVSTPEPETSEKQSSSKKRKKTLLAQILSNEQTKKKKTSIASFLQTL